tara:strand:+ start:141 stop:545 length:405 start_codon:yes stop_codon:yes gene_type:complete
MASEILVNDGGAPCRIIPMVVAVANVSAGDALSADNVASGDAKCQPLDTDLTEKNFLGVALTDANIGEVCNVITGRGVVVRINCANVDGGVALMAGDTAGQLKTMADGTGIFNHPVAITMEDNSGAGLTKCLTI